jgi:hypothetical protein
MPSPRRNRHHNGQFMVRLFRLAALAALSLFAVSARAQPAADPLRQAVTATVAANVAYAFDLHLETTAQSWRARFEPNANPRLRLIEPRRESLGNSDRRAFDDLAERTQGLSWCAGESMGQVADLRLLREDGETATYSFQPTRESIRGQARQFANRLRGELVMLKSAGDISRIRIFIPAPFSPAPLVQVEQINIAITCRAAPNGRRYAAETVSDVRGSAFGQAFDEHSIQRTTNLSAP